jgi:cell division protein FtsI (penicillin-binding protein 3)
MIDYVRELCRPLAPGGQCRPGQLRLEGKAQENLDTGRARLFVIGALFLAAFGAVAWRLVDVTLVKAAVEAKRNVPSRLAADADLPAREDGRGEIVDRHGQILATGIVTWSLYADPKMVVDAERAAVRLKALFPDLDGAELREKLKSEKRFVWLRRHMTPNEYQEVIAEGLPGIGARKDRRRVYPHGALTAHVVGYADIDANGIAGIERQFDGRLKRGERIQLSLDIRLQHAVREELALAVKKHRAIGAMAIVLDARNGEIGALVSLPDFDPHEPLRGVEETRFNRATLGTYEMGSTFKIFNTAMALDSGTASSQKYYDASRPLKHGKFTINDFHGLRRAMTVSEVFMFSSNIGSARMALEAGTARQMAFMGRAGMLKPTTVELPEAGAPLYPREWKPINTITIAYGHGISVTPLHLAAGVAGIVNDGLRPDVTILRRAAGEPAPTTPMMSAKTSAEMRRLMRLVVEKGTGKRAEAAGYLVGGKTGTADKSAGKAGYRRNTRIASFVAAFPINAPRHVVLVMVDEPKPGPEGGEATGGAVAAPVVREIALRIGPLLGIAPVESTSERPPDKAKPAGKPALRAERAANE